MQIAVLLKLVSQSTFMDSLAENVKDRLASGQLVINPADEYALELALRLRDRCNGSKVTVVTMSPACAEQVLYETLAMGADEAVHICDSAFAASDTLVTARILASALKKLPPQDMILCGQRSIDSETGHIGAQLAVYLEKPVITNTLSVWRDESDGAASDSSPGQWRRGDLLWKWQHYNDLPRNRGNTCPFYHGEKKGQRKNYRTHGQHQPCHRSQ